MNEEMIKTLEKALSWMETYYRVGDCKPNGPLAQDIAEMRHLISYWRLAAK